MELMLRFPHDYSVGNTPAKSLIKQVPVHQSIAKVLLLGCGDPRHILFTSWCIQQAGGLSTQQTFSVTTCDVEPSTIARNVILYRLIQDASNFQMVWSTFYDRVIDDPCMDLLVACATDLCAIGESLETWHGTEFGAIVKFVDEHTYAIIRGIWAVYARGKVSGEAASRMSECAGKFLEKSGVRGKRDLVTTGAFQTSPCQFPAASNIQVHSDIFHAYVSTGRSPHCSYPSKSSTTTHNPMMFRRADQHADVHYGLDPTLGYHLAAAYAQLKDGPLYSKSESKPSSKVDEKAIYSCCIREFSGWCHALKKSMDQRKIIIHNFAGDLFDLSHAMIHTRNNGYGKSGVIGSLKGGSIQLLPGVPLEYDVIDTSNVSDHVGLLNLLLACRELLSEGMQGTICTQFLHVVSENLDNRDVLLEEMLRTDLHTFAAITGLTLQDSMSNVTPGYANWTQFNISSSIVAALSNGSKRISVALEWTLVRPSAVRVNLKHHDFVEVFTEMYRKMFEFNLTIPNMLDLEGYIKKLKTEVAPFTGPSMQTFVKLVQIATKNLHSVESRTIKALIESILSLPFSGQQNQTCCLLTWFAALGLIPQTDANQMLGYDRTVHDLSVFGPNPSEIILLTLLIPKSATVGKLDKMTTPVIEMSVQVMGSDDRFSSLQTQYISERLATENNGEKCDGSSAVEYSNFTLVEGDISNYKFLACTTVVPISCLVGKGVKVSLSLPTSYFRVSPDAMEIVGPTAVVYSASLTDKQKVSFSAYYPEKYYVGREKGPYLLNSKSKDMKGAEWSPLTADVKHKRVASYSTKVDLQETDFFKIGGLKSCTPLLDSSTILRLDIQLREGQKTIAQLPVALNTTSATIQISRSKGYLNVLFPLSKGISCPALSMSSTRSTATQFDLLCTSRALLDCMPKVDLNADKKSTEWLYFLAGSQLGTHERGVEQMGIAGTAKSMKETIHCILISAIGRNPHLGGRRFKHFALHAEGTKSVIQLYVNSIRLDFDDGSVLIDAAVCVLTTWSENAEKVTAWLNGHMDPNGVCTTYVSTTELMAWKKALPAMCERTRNTWKHSSSCEYVSSGTDTIPLSASTSPERVVCSCCQGKGLEGSEFEKEVGSNHAVYKHFFRAAISPFFNTAKEGLAFGK